jgi:hypothetical protein
MIIWLVALLLLGLLALAGYYLGVIRVAISLVGLFFAAVLAMPLSPIVKPILPVVGLKHPIWGQIVPPLIIFILVMIVFKIVGMMVHRKVDVYFKYKVDDKIRLKWERLSRRLGMSLGLVNGAVYFVLLLIPIYVAGYLTTQVASAEGDPAGLRFINTVRAQIHDTKADKVIAGYDPAPKSFYEAADIIGLLKANPLLDSRLSKYPVFLSLAERKEFQDIANDLQIAELRARQAKIGEIIKQPKVQAVVTNAEIATQISTLLGSDLKDLHEYLLTGKSAKYDDEKILGFWTLNFDKTAAQEKVSNPKVTPFQLKQLKQTKYAGVRGMTFIATTDNKAILKKGANPPTVIADGTWKARGSVYDVTLGGATVEASFENGKLFFPRDGMVLVFEKEL